MKRQSGFTLIELIMVIVILGVLASFALPRFADLSDQAKTNTIKGVEASIRSASAITHAQFLAEGNNPNSITLEDGTAVAMIFGYPTDAAGGIAAAIDTNGVSTGVSPNISGGTPANPGMIFFLEDGGPCVFYIDPAADKSAPTISALDTYNATANTCTGNAI